MAIIFPDSHVDDATAAHSDERIRNVKRYVERNLSRRVRLSDAARLAALEKHYFAHVFRRNTQVTFTAWVRQRRVARAVDLLAKTTKSIGTVAREVGYRDWTGLERAFQMVLGSSPREVRRTLRAGTPIKGAPADQL